MKRIAALLIAPLVLLSACGGDDAPVDKNDDTRIRTTGWQSVTDPLTQREFRCYYASTGYTDGGIALWCYEPLDTTTATG